VNDYRLGTLAPTRVHQSDGPATATPAFGGHPSLNECWGTPAQDRRRISRPIKYADKAPILEQCLAE